jgi:hypothetical protein
MNQFMAIIIMPDFKDGEFLSLIPEQRRCIDRLMQQGTISSYTLSEDRTKLWVTILADSPDAAREIVDQFPLRRFMALEITGLTFHQTTPVAMPTLSMN